MWECGTLHKKIGQYFKKSMSWRGKNGVVLIKSDLKKTTITKCNACTLLDPVSKTSKLKESFKMTGKI